jgi:hypothetical protein
MKRKATPFLHLNVTEIFVLSFVSKHCHPCQLSLQSASLKCQDRSLIQYSRV